jgi:hypothetical protein
LVGYFACASASRSGDSISGLSAIALVKVRLVVIFPPCGVFHAVMATTLDLKYASRPLLFEALVAIPA